MNSNTSSRKIEVATLCISGLTAATVIIGGILGYQFRDRWFVKESQSNIELAELDASLKRMERDVKTIRDELDVASKRAELSVDVSNLITDLQPNMAITLTKEAYKDNVIALEYNVANNGRRSVVVEPPRVYVSPINEFPSLKQENLYRDDYYQVHTYQIGFVPPRSNANIQTLEIRFPNSPEFEKLYYSIVFEVNVQEEIQALSKSLLTDVMDSESIEELSRRTYNMHGSVGVQ